MTLRRPGFLEGLQKIEDTALLKILRGMKDFTPAFVVEKLCGDSDFVEAFTRAVPKEEEQKKFLVHTSKYSLGQKDYDPQYVLFFRRTLSSSTPKREERWTNEYVQVRNGLKREIPEGPHRLHSIILCDSLEHLLSNGQKEGDTKPYTDGEIVVNWPAYDQNKSILAFKPSAERTALEEYVKTEGSLSAEDLLQMVKDSKNY